MKAKIASASAMLLLVVLVFMQFGFASADKAAQPTPPPSNAVGYVDANGNPQLLMNKLVKKFQNGGDIYQFFFYQFNDGWNLVRRGTYPNNAGYRTEAFRVSLNSPWIIYTPVWFTVCSHITCIECHANASKTSCDCPTGGGCTFGLTDLVPIDDVVIGG